METILNSFKKKEKEEVNLMSPLVWAYIGDAVYELYIRDYFINTTNLNAHKLHIKSISYVKASAQANILEKLMLDLTEEEKDIVRRARNTRKSSYSKKCKCSRLYTCNSIWRINRVFIFNRPRRKIKRNFRKMYMKKRVESFIAFYSFFESCGEPNRLTDVKGSVTNSFSISSIKSIVKVIGLFPALQTITNSLS